MITRGSPILGNIKIYSGGVNQWLSGKKTSDFSLDMINDLDLQITSTLHSAALQYKRRIKKVKISVHNCALPSYKLEM